MIIHQKLCCLSVKFIMHETTNAENWVKLNLYNLGSILWRHFHYQITQFLIMQLRANYLFVKTIQAFKSQLISWYSFWQDFTNYAGNIEGFTWRRY